MPSPATPPFQTGITDFQLGTGTLTCPNLPIMSFQSNRPWTMEMWVYLDALVDQATLISRPGEFALEMRSGTLVAGRAGDDVHVSSSQPLVAHAWYHVAVAFSNQTLLLYVNGRQVGSQAVTANGPPNGGQPFTIGGGFYGQSDSVRLWNIAVPPQQLYQHQWTAYPPGTPGLVAQLDLAANPPVDTSGRNVPVTVNPGVGYRTFIPAVALSTGAFCDPYDDGEEVNPGGTAADFSVMAWVCPADTTSVMTIFSNGSAGDTAGMSLMVAPGGQVQMQIGHTVAQTSMILAPGSWYNVACTWSSATSTAVLYINGTAASPATTMPLTGQCAGAPLVGAWADGPGNLPLWGFEGLVQSVSVWNVALTAAQVQEAQSANPTDQPNCVANYMFSAEPAQNYASLNPVGLVGGARMIVSETVPGGHGMDVVPSPPRPASRLGFADQGGPTLGLREADLGEEMRERQLADFREWLAGAGIGGEEAAALEARMAANLDRAREDIRAGRYRPAFHFEVAHDGGQMVLTLHSAEGPPVEFYRGVELDPCMLWVVSFIIAIGGAALTAFGFVLNYSAFAKGLTSFLGARVNTIGLLPQLSAVFKSGITVTNVWKAVNLFHEFKLLFPMLSVMFKGVAGSLTIWAIISLTGRILLLLSPAAALQVALFLTELAYGIYVVIDTWNKKPTGCLT